MATLEITNKDFDPKFDDIERAVLRRLIQRLAALSPETLNDLQDVDVLGASEGDVIRLRSGIWEAEPAPAGAETLDELTDVSTVADPPFDGAVLTYSGNGSVWFPGSSRPAVSRITTTSSTGSFIPNTTLNGRGGDSFRVITNNTTDMTYTLGPTPLEETSSQFYSREITIIQGGTGKLTIAAGTGVTVNTPAGFLPTTAGLNSVVRLVRVNTSDATKNTWNISGDLLPDPASMSSVLIVDQTLTSADSGKVFFIDSTAPRTFTLPAPALGLKFEFIVVTPPTGGDHLIQTASLAQIMSLQQNMVTSNSSVGTLTSGRNTIAIKTGNGAETGDRIILNSNGTLWIGTAFTYRSNGVDFATF